MRAELLRAAAGCGFARAWFLPPAMLSALPRKSGSFYGGLKYEAPEWCRAIMICAYPYALFEDCDELPEYYLASQRAYRGVTELAERLAAAGITAERVNFPMKELLEAAGVGTVGKNGLIRIGDLGSAVVLWALAVDADCAGTYAGAPPGCGGCTRCRDACPTGAIGAGGLTVCRCLRAHMGGPVHHDAAKALMKTYLGCMECIRACPYNTAREPVPAETAAAFAPARLIAGDDAEARRLLGKNKTGGGKLVAEAIILHPGADFAAAEAIDSPAVADAVRWARGRENA